MRVACYTCVNKQVIASNPSSGAAACHTPVSCFCCSCSIAVLDRPKPHRSHSRHGCQNSST
jgi:hypothetical protein